MSHLNRPLLAIAVTMWLAVGAVTVCQIIWPLAISHDGLILLWLHSAAIVLTVTTISQATYRACVKAVRDPFDAYQLGLDHGAKMADSFHHRH